MANANDEQRGRRAGTGDASTAPYVAPATEERPAAQTGAIANAAMGGGASAASAPNINGLASQADSVVQNNRLSHVDTSSQKSMLDQWLDTQTQQNNAQIDRGVTQGVNELSRTWEDAESQYQTQQNQIDANERRALDNQALYAAARGDRGGIGTAQYNSVQNAAMQNRVTVNTARTKMKTDIFREIAELRANGEFQKADAALSLTQQYLQQLMSLEQWAIQTNLSVDQFNAQLAQWAQDYKAKAAELGINMYQFNETMSFNREQADKEDYWRGKEYERLVGRDAAEDERYAQEYAYREKRDTVADRQWEQNRLDERADVAWNQAHTLDRDKADDKYRSDTLAESKRQYDTSLAENKRQFDTNITERQADRAESKRQYDTSLAENKRQFDTNITERQADRAESKRQYDTSLAENKRQFDTNITERQADRAESKRQYDTSLAENKRQYDTSLAENKRQYDTTTAQNENHFQQNLGFQQKQFDRSAYENDRNYDFTQKQYADTLKQRDFENSVTTQQLKTQNQNRLASEAITLINSGIVPDSERLAAAGITRADAEDRISVVLAQEALGVKSSQLSVTGQQLSNEGLALSNEGKRLSNEAAQTQLDALKNGSLGDSFQDATTQLFEDAKASGNPQSYITNNYKKYGLTSSSGLYNDYKNWASGSSGGMSYEDARSEADAGVWSDAIYDGLASGGMSFADIVRVYSDADEENGYVHNKRFLDYMTTKVGDGPGNSNYENIQSMINTVLNGKNSPQERKVQEIQKYVNNIWNGLSTEQRLLLISLLSKHNIDINF